MSGTNNPPQSQSTIDTQGASTTPDKAKQPSVSKSVTPVPSKRHKHEWVLIEKWDSKAKSYSERNPLPKGQWVSRGGLFGGVSYIPGFDRTMLLENIVETIREDYEPRYTSETWACHCGERKVNSHKHASLIDLLSTDPDTKSRSSEAQS